MTRTNKALAALAEEEFMAWVSHAEALSPRVAEMFLGNAQGGEADLEDYEIRQMMAEGF